MRRIVETEDAEGSEDAEAWRWHGNYDHGLLLVARSGGIGLAHEDHDAAARVHRTRRPPLPAVEDVALALPPDRRLHVGRVGGRDGWLGHGKAAAGATAEEVGEELALELAAAVLEQNLHVARVRRRAVEHLRRPWHRPHHLRQPRVVHVAQARAMRGVGVEVARDPEVPQAPRLRLLLELLQLPRDRPALLALRMLRHAPFGRVDKLQHEALQAARDLAGCRRGVGKEIARGGRGGGHGAGGQVASQQRTGKGRASQHCSDRDTPLGGNGYRTMGRRRGGGEGGGGGGGGGGTRRAGGRRHQRREGSNRRRGGGSVKCREGRRGDGRKGKRGGRRSGGQRLGLRRVS
eukprot:327535-Hanusia_phi.AAC.2